MIKYRKLHKQTIRPINERIKEHVRDCRDGKENTAFSKLNMEKKYQHRF